MPSAAPGRGRRAAGDRVQRRDRVAEISISPASSRLPTGVPGQGAGAAETVLQEPDPAHVGLAGGLCVAGSAGEGGQGHPQVAGRQQAQLAAQPAGRPAVVGDGDHRGDVDVAVGEQPQRGQRGVQAVAAAEGDHLRAARSRGYSLAAQVAVGHAGRPAVALGQPAPRSPRLIATLRCLPPVQPTARVR